MTGFKQTWVYKTFVGIFGSDSLLNEVFHSTVDGIKTYEEQHGKADLKIALDAGLVAYNKAKASGTTKAPALVQGVVAFFESEAEAIKTVATEDAMAALAGYVK